jgi:hypothetical protein
LRHILHEREDDPNPGEDVENGFVNVLCDPSQGRSPGHYGKDEHGQERESQRRGRHGIPIAPHGYE